MGNLARLAVGYAIGLGLWGLLTLVIGKTGVIRGSRARILGLFALLPAPTAFGLLRFLGFFYGLYLVVTDQKLDTKDPTLAQSIMLLWIVVTVGYSIAILLLYSKWKLEALAAKRVQQIDGEGSAIDIAE